MKLLSKIDRYLEDKNYQIIIKNNSINIINFKEIIDFSNNQISVKCNDHIIIVDGCKLIITKMLDDEILISGTISNIRIN